MHTAISVVVLNLTDRFIYISFHVHFKYLAIFFMLLSVNTLYTAQLDSASAKNRNKIALSEQISVLRY